MVNHNCYRALHNVHLPFFYTSVVIVVSRQTYMLVDSLGWLCFSLLHFHPRRIERTLLLSSSVGCCLRSKQLSKLGPSLFIPRASYSLRKLGPQRRKLRTRVSTSTSLVLVQWYLYSLTVDQARLRACMYYNTSTCASGEKVKIKNNIKI